MKPIFIICVLITFMGLSATGQYTVETPWGTTVNVTYVAPQNEMGLTSRLYWDSIREDAYPQADFQPTWPNLPYYPNLSSTNRFNCHGYAWHMYWLGTGIQDQLAEPYNMAYTEAEEYFNDPSFAECAQAEADIWWINGGTHSALATDVSTKLKSKWDIGPLATHGFGDDDFPNAPITSVTYYKHCYQEVTGDFDSDVTMNYCSVQLNNTIVDANVDLIIEYEKAVRFEGIISTGTGVTIYIHPD